MVQVLFENWGVKSANTRARRFREKGLCASFDSIVPRRSGASGAGRYLDFIKDLSHGTYIFYSRGRM